MTLIEWQKNEWLVKHTASRQEVKHLFRLIERDLKDCRNKELSVDWRFNIAYNAALQCAHVTLSAAGFRAAKDAHHFRVIQSLKFTLEMDDKTIRRFDSFRKKRNVSEYDQAGPVSIKELEQMIALADSLYQATKSWLELHHADLF